MRRITLAAGLVLATLPAHAFQIAPMGTKSEARHTNEAESGLAKVAGRLGVLIKAPVHEEITQLGFDCPAEKSRLTSDKLCHSADASYANPFVIYGVRWNDVPPFMLGEGEGRCEYYGKRCNTTQTIRFATQPMCWYCLFDSAAKTASTRPIVGCGAQPNESAGNLMTRSHFGDLQLLHAMAARPNDPASVTHAALRDWLMFSWKVASREIAPEQKLREIEIPMLRQRFGCSEWTVAQLYILGQMSSEHGLAEKINQIAFGSLLHTVQDSFAAGHVARDAQRAPGLCTGTNFRRLPAILEFHNYAAQDGGLHDHEDRRAALVASGVEDWPLAVEATKNLARLFERHASWEEAQPYLRCLIELSPGAGPATAGTKFVRPPAEASSLRRPGRPRTAGMN